MRFSRQQRTVLAVLAAAAVVVGLLAAMLGRGEPATATKPSPSPAAATEPRTTPAPGKCAVQIYTGQDDSPYYRYGTVLARLIATSGKGWSAGVQPSQGTADNIRTLQQSPRPQCALAVVQLNGAVDAARGTYQFAGLPPVTNLRTIGPLNYDLVHLMVRADSPIHRLEDLCHRRVAVGFADSGTEQISDVLLRVAGLGSCGVATDTGLSLASGLGELRDPHGRVQAVFWAGGAPTPRIVEEMRPPGGTRLRFIPLDAYRERIQADWDQFYAGHRPYFPGTVFDTGEIRPRDYPGSPIVPTIATPNGIVALASADPELVTFVTRALFEHRGELARAIWPDGGSGRSLPDARTVYENPLYCYVPLHDQAAAYYRAVLGSRQPCPRA